MPPDLDEELAAHQEEQRRKKEWAGIRAAKGQLKKRAIKAGSKAIARAAARAAASAVATGIAWIWPVLAAIGTAILVLILITAIIAVTIMVISYFCNPTGWKGGLAKFTGAKITGGFSSDVCEAFEGFSGVVSKIDLGSRVLKLPGRRVDVSRWDNEIREAAGVYELSYCYLRSFVEKESSGDPLAIGHDHTAPPPPIKRWQSSRDGQKASEPEKTHDPFNQAETPKHNLDWNFSHGIGLLQITIFPLNHDLGRQGWIDSNTPAREMPPVSKTKYQVLELLDPGTSINAAAAYLRQLVKQLNDYQRAAAAYNGSGPRADAYGADIIGRTTLCEKT